MIEKDGKPCTVEPIHSNPHGNIWDKCSNYRHWEMPNLIDIGAGIGFALIEINDGERVCGEGVFHGFADLERAFLGDDPPGVIDRVYIA